MSSLPLGSLAWQWRPVLSWEPVPCPVPSLYPSFEERGFGGVVALAALPQRDYLDGISLVQQLRDATAKRERPAITTHNQGNHGIRSVRWRYIRYADGSGELYPKKENDKSMVGQFSPLITLILTDFTERISRNLIHLLRAGALLSNLFKISIISEISGSHLPF